VEADMWTWEKQSLWIKTLKGRVHGSGGWVCLVCDINLLEC